MNPYRALLDIISKPSRVTGVMVTASPALYGISTVYGSVLVPRRSGDTYAVGDTVIVSGGAIVGKVTGIGNLPIYYV